MGVKTVTYDKNIFSSYLIKGNIRCALNYLEGLPENDELIDKYHQVFIRNNRLARAKDKLINELDQIYQQYYIDVFWHKERNDAAESRLFSSLWTFCGADESNNKNSQIEEKVGSIVRKHGYEFLGGRTAGYYGPYIWKSSTKDTYEVELPSGIETYSVIMMDGFVSNSWLDFISFGVVSTGGWIGDDGTLCCIKSLHNLESKEFLISFLKHEAQHGYDKTLFSNITSIELEYRAKLVELIYWDDEKIIMSIHRDAESSDEKNTHAMASHRLISDLSRKLFNRDYETDIVLFSSKLDEIRVAANELLQYDTKRLSEINALLITEPYQYKLCHAPCSNLEARLAPIR